MKRLIIGKIKKEKTDFGSRMFCEVKRDGESFELFYDYNLQELDLLDDNFADPFLVSLLPYAMNKEYDIECDDPVSSDLFYNIVFDYIPVMSKYTKYFNKINIICKTKKKEIKNNNAVVTGASCGVDSLYSIFSVIENTNLTNDSKLTHLLVMNSGACSWAGGEQSYKWFIEESKRSELLASELNLGFIYVNTNLMEFYGSDHRISNYCRMSGVILGLDKMIKKYHFASGYELDEFTVNPKDKDDGYYAYFICNTMSDNNLRFFLTGNSFSRTERVKYFADNELASKYLNVCINGAKNCGHCEKCLRTIGALYSIGKLNFFAQSFDVNDFYRKKTRYVAQMIYYKKFHKCFYDFMKTIKRQHKIMYFNATLLYFLYYNPTFTIKKYSKNLIFKILKKDSKKYIYFRDIYRKLFKKNHQ